MVNHPEDIGRTESNASGYEPLDERFDPLIDDFIIKERRYAHFDCPLSKGQRSNFSLHDINLSSHNFWPLLAFEIPRRKRVFNSDGEFSGFISKPRPIKFGSHQDAAILQLYARELGDKYERYLSNKDYKNSILAYRKNMGDNVIQAKSIFDEIRTRGECIAIALDISKFFDKIEHAVLKDCLGAVLGGVHLSRDDYHIWKSVCKYAYVDSEKLKTRLGKKYNRNGRICSSGEFRNIVRGKDPQANLVKSNDQQFGIPQGLPISGLYANITLIDFDDTLFGIVRSLGGIYKRYSDDLAVVLPIGTNTEDLINKVSHELAKIGLSINSDKTEVVVFSQKGGKLNAPKPFQYLGFTFDGERILIRQSSIHNYYRKMRKGIRAKVYAAKNQNIERNNIYAAVI